MLQIKANIAFLAALVVMGVMIYSGMTVFALFVVALMRSRGGGS